MNSYKSIVEKKISLKINKTSEQTFCQRRPTDDQQVHEKVFHIINHQGNANKNHNEIPHLLKWLLSKRQEITSVGTDMERKKTFCTIARNVNWHKHYGKQYGSSSEKL